MTVKTRQTNLNEVKFFSIWMRVQGEWMIQLCKELQLNPDMSLKQKYIEKLECYENRGPQESPSAVRMHARKLMHYIHTAPSKGIKGLPIVTERGFCDGRHRSVYLLANDLPCPVTVKEYPTYGQRK